MSASQTIAEERDGYIRLLQQIRAELHNAIPPEDRVFVLDEDFTGRKSLVGLVRLVVKQRDEARKVAKFTAALYRGKAEANG